MKCTNRIFKKRKYLSVLMVSVAVCVLTSCGNVTYEMPYDADGNISGYNVLEKNNSLIASSFAEDLCVVTGNLLTEEEDGITATSAILCDVNHAEVLYAKNPHERLQAASLTKVMTALVALKYGSIDQTLTATNSVNITESGAQLCGLKAGDRMTLNQALHVLLMNSANDAAMLIAENIGGSVENFVEMMNEEAKALGATNTNFANPHGLTDDTHYTTAYDLYLIFNEAIKYEKFMEIIQMTSYEMTYYDGNGNVKELSFGTTNWYLRGNTPMPENITVIGGKTGVTNVSKHCLMVLSRDANGAPYISVILRCDSRDLIYTQMTELLNKISK